MSIFRVWFYWALLAAILASLTAIFAKVGLQGTLIRTGVILPSLGLFIKPASGVALSGLRQSLGIPDALASRDWPSSGRGFAIFAHYRWAKRLKWRVDVDKCSVGLVAIFAVIFLGERPLAKDWLGSCWSALELLSWRCG